MRDNNRFSNHLRERQKPKAPGTTADVAKDTDLKKGMLLRMNMINSIQPYFGRVFTLAERKECCNHKSQAKETQKLVK